MKIKPLFLFAPILLASCSSSVLFSSLTSSSSLPPSTTNSPSSFTWDSLPEEDDFFASNARSTIAITATPEVLSFISLRQGGEDRTYADAYLPVDVTITRLGQTYVYEEVGMRMKGNMSRNEFYQGGRFLDYAHFKLNFKATFDSSLYDDAKLLQFKHDWSEDAAGRKERKNRNFLGLEKLDLKYVPRNAHESGYACCLRELYCYEAFRSAGIPAPKATIASFSLSDGSSMLSGDYEAVETIDKEFLKRRYSSAEAKGNLYKCVYNRMGKADLTREGAVDKSTGERLAKGKIGVEDNYDHYVPVYQLKTNDDNGEGSDFSDMANLIVTLRDCIYADKTLADLESVLDVDEFLRMSAVSFLLGNFDDQRYNWNNYYLYFRPSDHKAIIIPYDWDWSLGLDMTGRLAEMGPLDTWTLGGGNPSNLYLATLFGKTKYDREPMQATYLKAVASYAPMVLDENAYQDFAARYGDVGQEETPSVLEYMRKKSRHIA